MKQRHLYYRFEDAVFAFKILIMSVGNIILHTIPMQQPPHAVRVCNEPNHRISNQITKIVDQIEYEIPDFDSIKFLWHFLCRLDNVIIMHFSLLEFMVI